MDGSDGHLLVRRWGRKPLVAPLHDLPLGHQQRLRGVRSVSAGLGSTIYRWGEQRVRIDKRYCDGCKKQQERARARKRRVASFVVRPRACGCGHKFTPERANQIYFPLTRNACKQRARRTRHKPFAGGRLRATEQDVP